MRSRGIIGSLQLPIAGLGGLLLVGALVSLLTMPPSPPESEGFVRGLAILVLFVAAWAGFVIIAIGLAIQPRTNTGIRFNQWQRRLFILAAILSVFSLLTPLIFWSVVATTGISLGSATLTWVVVMTLAILSLFTGLGWRISESITTRLRA